MWLVSSSSEYDEWFSSLDEQSKEAVLVKVYLLQEFGPQLGRSYVDTLKGTENKRNLKELRCQSPEHVLRIAFYFDPKRNAFLLIGGDKKGKNEDRFYRDLICKAETIIEQHEKEQEKDEERN